MNPLTPLATTLYLAGGYQPEPDDCDAAYKIMCGELWGVIQAFSGSIAVLAVLAGIGLMIKNFMAARPGGVFKSLLLTILAAALLANLQFIAALIDLGSGAMSLVLDTLSGFLGDGD